MHTFCRSQSHVYSDHLLTQPAITAWCDKSNGLHVAYKHAVKRLKLKHCVQAAVSIACDYS